VFDIQVSVITFYTVGRKNATLFWTKP